MFTTTLNRKARPCPALHIVVPAIPELPDSLEPMVCSVPAFLLLPWHVFRLGGKGAAARENE